MKKYLISIIAVLMIIAGWLVFRSVNSSGKPVENATRTVRLFYYNQNNDKDTSGNVQCTEKGLASVDRQISFSQTPIQDTMRLLLKGEITAKERIEGISSEFPLEGFVFLSSSLKDGILTLTFYDPMNKTSGGACRANILRAQVEATAKQFSGINEVRFSPESLFRP